jgi:hypothetical protein
MPSPLPVDQGYVTVAAAADVRRASPSCFTMIARRVVPESIFNIIFHCFCIPVFFFRNLDVIIITKQAVARKAGGVHGLFMRHILERSFGPR